MPLKMAQAILRRTNAADEALFRRHAAQSHRPPTAGGKPVRAYVNHGRWVADCDCGAGLAVDIEWAEARCYDCFTMRPVIWPDAEKRDAIDRLLLLRTRMSERNWEHKESLKDLQDENVAHGLPYTPLSPEE